MKTTEINTDYGISEMLNVLGIKANNKGASTGTKWFETTGEVLESWSSADGEKIASLKQATADDYEKIISTAQDAFIQWRMLPAPARGRRTGWRCSGARR